MKTRMLTASRPKFYFQIFLAVFLTVLMLTACQKTPEPETANETQAPTDVQSIPVTTAIDENSVNNNNNATGSSPHSIETTVKTEQKDNLSELENNIGAAGVTPNAQTTAPSPEQTIKGTQITDMRYKNAAGEGLSVVFETSATGVLNAIVTLPNKPKMTLSGPEGQGNNPTYHSTDGSIELVSHGGGSTIDIIQNNKVTSFDAISADAEVVTKQ